MSLHPHPLGPIPEETARIARAAFPHSSTFMQLREALGTLYTDEDFGDLYACEGAPAETPWRVALVTVMQFAEGLTDRQAADAVRSRLDWKYALGLEVTDAGFDHTVLSDFRARVLAGGAEQRFLDLVLTQMRERGWLKTRGRQRTDSTHVLAAIRTLTRLTNVGETLRHALNSLATVVPDWLRALAPVEWSERYGERIEEYRLPKEKPERAALAATMGTDGLHLRSAVYAPSAPAWLREVPAVETLRRVWLQQYEAPDEQGVVRWRAEKDLPPTALLIHSPYDVEARYGTKRSTSWVGYKVHLTETCDADTPHLITHVETTTATTNDVVVTPQVHEALAEKDLLPAQHLVDSGYMDADHLVTRQAVHHLDLLGPVSIDTPWQARAQQGFANAAFTIDGKAHTATCPQGHTSVQWSRTHNQRDHPIINIEFARATCLACPCRAACTQSTNAPRGLTIQPHAQYVALHAARARQETAEFAAQYAARAGVEGTMSQSTGAFGLRRTRYIGLARTHLQHIVTAVAINVARLVAWLQDTPFARARPSRFTRLAPAA